MNIDYTAITISASTGTQAFTGLGIDMTAAGVEPFLRFFGGQTTTEGSNQGNWVFLEGYATGLSGSETWTHYGFSNDNSTGFAGDENYAGSGSIKIVDLSGTTICEFTIDSWGADGFTINKTTASTAIRLLVMYGTATNAQCLVATCGAATGNEDVTGLSWSPSDNAIVFVSGGANNNDPNTRANDLYAMHGVASVDAQFAHSARISDGTVYAQGNHANSDSSFISTASYGGTLIGEASFVSWITNGFRTNWTTAQTSRYHGFLVIDDGLAGDKCRAALWTTQAGTGAETFDTGEGSGKTPQLVCLQSDGDAADTLTANNDGIWTRGISNGTNQESICITYEDGVKPANAIQRYENTSSNYILNVAGTLTDDINIISLTVDGFEANHDANAGAKFVGVALMGLAQECIYYETTATPPAVIKVDGICYYLNGSVEDTGQTTVAPSGFYDNCGACQSSPFPDSSPFPQSSPFPESSPAI